jgi:hypothetical protein
MKPYDRERIRQLLDQANALLDCLDALAETPEERHAELEQIYQEAVRLTTLENGVRIRIGLKVVVVPTIDCEMTDVRLRAVLRDMVGDRRNELYEFATHG